MTRPNQPSLARPPVPLDALRRLIASHLLLTFGGILVAGSLQAEDRPKAFPPLDAPDDVRNALDPEPLHSAS